MNGWLRFGLLLVAATGLALLFQALHLPAGWLFGPLVISALFAVRGWDAVAVPGPIYIAAQAVIGTAMGAGFSPNTLAILPQHWVIFLSAVVFILLTSLLNGWLLTRHTRVDAATAFLGTMPGGAGAMAAMSDSLHADTRLVVAMQYIRLLIILGCMAFFVPLLGHFFAHSVSGQGTMPLPGTTAGNLWLLVAVALVGWIVGIKTSIPAGSFLIPALLYFGLTWYGFSPGAWPLPVRCAAYLIMGLRIGGQFHASTVDAVRDLILPVVGTTLLLLLGAMALAVLLAVEMQLDPASAYLAATPGGLDSVAVLSAELHVDTGVILCVQLVRLLCVLAIGPWLVKACTRWLGRAEL